MGLLTELFIAPEKDAPSFDHRSGARFERERLGGLTNLEFETLWAILEDVEWDAKKHALAQVASTDASWTFRFPQGYVDRLLKLAAPERARAAAAWAATEEISASPSDVEPVITKLVSLARRASSEGQGLFLWTAL